MTSSADVTGPIPFGGLDSTDPLAFKVYEPDRLVLGKRMEDHLRPGVCFWHSFAWPGVDMFGSGRSTGRGSTATATTMAAARTKMAVAFEFFAKLGVPYYCFHDRDVAPEGDELRRRSARTSTRSTDDAAGYQERTGVRFLWGTANLFTHPRYQAGAATNPDPEVFAYAAAQVKHMLEVTQRLGGENYVLWGGREGYDTLLNTDLRREGGQLARFLHLVAEHKHRIGFTGQLLIEPKPMEPTKHQYDYDVATVHGFLVTHGLEGEYRRQHRGEPRDAGRPQLPSRGRLRGRERHPRQHRRQPRRLRRTAGTPTSSRTRSRTSRCRSTRSSEPAASRPAASTSTRSSAARALDRTDLFHAHIGGIDTLARALLVAADLIEQRRARRAARSARYAGLGRRARRGDPRRRRDARDARGEGRRRRRSTRARRPGHQELLENVVNRSIWAADASAVKSGAGR